MAKLTHSLILATLLLLLVVPLAGGTTGSNSQSLSAQVVPVLGWSQDQFYGTDAAATTVIHDKTGWFKATIIYSR